MYRLQYKETVQTEFAWFITLLPSNFFSAKMQHEGSKLSAQLLRATAKQQSDRIIFNSDHNITAKSFRSAKLR